MVEETGDAVLYREVRRTNVPLMKRHSVKRCKAGQTSTVIREEVERCFSIRLTTDV